MDFLELRENMEESMGRIKILIDNNSIIEASDALKSATDNLLTLENMADNDVQERSIERLKTEIALLTDRLSGKS